MQIVPVTPAPDARLSGLEKSTSMEHMLNWFWLVLQKDHADLQSLHAKWNKDDLLLRNSGSEMLDGGNLAADFIGTLSHRMFARPMQVHFASDNPDSDQSAQDLGIVAQSLLRTSMLKEEMETAYRDSKWATTGWLEVNHPMNPESMDFERRRDMQLAQRVQPSNLPTDWMPADHSAMMSAGIDPEDDFDVDPTFMPPQQATEPAKPLFAPLFGTPYVRRVDPRLMLFPPTNLRTMEQAWYIGRLHFMSPRELGRLFPDQLDGKSLPYNLAGTIKDIYQATCTQRHEMQFSQLVCVVEVYFQRCQLYPDLNGLRVIFLWQYPRIVLYAKRAPYGGMIPFVPIKAERLKAICDTSKAEELRSLSVAYNEIIQSIGDRAHDALNLKRLEGPGLGLTPTEGRKLDSPTYKGSVKVQNKNDFMFYQVPFDQGLISALVFLRSQGQLAIGASDMDVGKAIKDITARQVETLNSATGANLDSEKDEVRKSAKQALLMLLQFAGLFSHMETGQSYTFEGRSVYLDKGRPDLITSALFEIQIEEDGEDLSADDRLVLSQFLRVIMGDPTGKLFMGLDPAKLLRLLLRKFGLSYNEVASQQPPQSQVVPSPVAGGGPPGLQSEGQHPERQLGDRGLSVANALDGLRTTGT